MAAVSGEERFYNSINGDTYSFSRSCTARHTLHCGSGPHGVTMDPMLRFLTSLFIALGLTFAPAMMARVAAAPVAAIEHCHGAMPAKHQGKADAKSCCSTACPMTAALPSQPSPALARVASPARISALLPVFLGLDPDKDTPPPRASPVI
jgi:hypothetical protein